MMIGTNGMGLLLHYCGIASLGVAREVQSRVVAGSRVAGPDLCIINILCLNWIDDIRPIP